MRRGEREVHVSRTAYVWSIAMAIFHITPPQVKRTFRRTVRPDLVT